MQIELVATGALMSELDWYESNPTVSFAWPLTDEVLRNAHRAFPDIPLARVFASPPDREALMSQARAAVEQWREAQERASMRFEHAGRSWDGGLAVRSRMRPPAELGAVPVGFFWTDADNNDVPTDFIALQALNLAHEQALVAQGFAIHQRQRMMKEALPSLTDEQLQTFVPGWN